MKEFETYTLIIMGSRRIYLNLCGDEGSHGE